MFPFLSPNKLGGCSVKFISHIFIIVSDKFSNSSILISLEMETSEEQFLSFPSPKCTVKLLLLKGIKLRTFSLYIRLDVEDVAISCDKRPLSDFGKLLAYTVQYQLINYFFLLDYSLFGVFELT